MPLSTLIFCLVGVACALVGSFLTSVTERQDVKHYYETYTWAEWSDGLYIVAGLGLLVPSGVVFVQLGRNESVGPAGTVVQLVVMAAIAAALAAAAAGVFRRGPRVLVPGLLTGGAVGVVLLAVANLLGWYDRDLFGTAALGWLLGLGGAVVVLLIKLVTAGDPVP